MDTEVTLLKLKYEGMLLDNDLLLALIEDLKENDLIIWAGSTHHGLLSLCVEYLPDSMYSVEHRLLEENSTFVVLQESDEKEKEILDLIRNISLNYSWFNKSTSPYLLNVVVI